VTRLLFLLLALGLLACDEQGPLLPSRNQCFENAGCGGRPAYCDPVLLRCVRDTLDEPYPLFVRVSASTPGMLADAGIQLVPEVVHDLGAFAGRRDAQVLQIPQALDVTGSVTELDGGQVVSLLHSQVTIIASDAAVPISSRVIETRSDTVRRDGGAPANLSLQLDPGRHYDVRVQPLAAASARLPPFIQTDVGADQPLVLEAPSVEARSGRFLYRDESQHADLARLEERGTGRILSSTARVAQREGTSSSGEPRREGLFTLYARPQVFESRSFDLVISLGGHAPWQATITIDGERFLTGGDMLLPAAPRPVTVAGVVEDHERRRLTGSELVFVSSYPVPPTRPDVDETPSVPTALGSDWCRWQDPARVSCSGRFQTLSNEAGDYSIELIPGLYDIFLVPRGAARARNVIVTRHEDDSHPGTPFLVGEGSGLNRLILQANVAVPYKGTVFASGAPAPHITLRALRRPTPSPSSWGPLADFNRTFSVVSDRKGHFSIAPDVGYYDFVFEPELGSDFPWKLWLDCPNGPGAGGPLAAVELSAPVMVFGSVEVEAMGTKLPGAKIEAFTIVEAKNREPRSVMIGRAVSDQDGDYILALPPVVGEKVGEQGRCEGEALRVRDNGRSGR
jgi:hypothetical protein